jgi:hypothetical protein
MLEHVVNIDVLHFKILSIDPCMAINYGSSPPTHQGFGNRKKASKGPAAQSRLPFFLVWVSDPRSTSPHPYGAKAS